MYSMNMIAATMITKTIVWFIVLSISTITVGLTDFSCETTRPLKGSNVTCTCNSTNNIDWQLNDVSLSICTTTGVCLPQEDGYSFQTDTNSAEKKYSLTVLGYDYSSCTVYSCTDITTTVEEKMTLSIAAFNSTSPSVIVEPGNHQNGRIEITTECLFKESDIAVEWYTVNGKKENKYTPETDASFKTSSACTDTCNGEAAVKLNIGFTHTEEKSKIFKQTVQFRLKVYHKEDRSNILNLTTTGDYYIKGGFPCWLIIVIVVLVLVVPFVTGIGFGCCIIHTTCCCDCFKKGESCKDCVDNYYCKCKCFDSTPCRVCCNIKGLPSWYQVLWASIIGSHVAFGIWLVWKFSKKGNNDTSTNAVGTGSSPKNAGTKLLEKEKVSQSPGKADNANKEKHASEKQHQHDDQAHQIHLENEGKKAVRPQPPPPAGANPSREGSGSVVSGRDVKVHETDNSFVKSQLPNIHTQGHDSKGRSLSANFSDDYHPLAGVGTPSEKAGTLPTITDTPRETKKRTKKKKKKDKQEDNQTTETAIDF